MEGEGKISSEHVHNNVDIRELLIQRGIKPEALPPEQDIKKLERRVKKEEKKIAKGNGQENKS